MKVAAQADTTHGGGGASATLVDLLAADMLAVDRLMARVIRRLGDAAGTTSGGLPAGRAVALLAAATGMHLSFLQRVVDCLHPMPLLSATFQDGRVSWSQVRGIVLNGDRLRIAARAQLDDLLATEIASARTGEPDRIVEVAGDLAFRSTETPDSTSEVADLDRNVVIAQPTLLGRMRLFGDVDIETGAAVMEAVDLLAEPPISDQGDDAARDADGRTVPGRWAPVPPSHRSTWRRAMPWPRGIRAVGSRGVARPPSGPTRTTSSRRQTAARRISTTWSCCAAGAIRASTGTTGGRSWMPTGPTRFGTAGTVMRADRACPHAQA